MGMKNTPRLDLNPSAADRWTTCTASPQFILDNADKLAWGDTAWSTEGTTAHEVAAAFLQDREPRVKDKKACPAPVTPEMLGHGWDYMEYVQALREPGSTLLVEQKLPLWYMPGRNAIVDAAVINKDSLHIVDYKYGAGVLVSPVESLQASIYATTVIFETRPFVCAQNDWDFPITIHIFQPRARESDTPHKWETSWGEVYDLTRKATYSAHDILEGNPKFKELTFAPSDKACQWCPAKGFCTARQASFAADLEPLAEITDTVPTLLPAKAVTMKQLCAILKHKDAIVKWLNDAEDYAHSCLSTGRAIPGYKLVMSRAGNRYWSNPKEAAKLLLETSVLRKSEVIEEKVISVAEAEKLLGKHKFNTELTNLISRPPGRPVIAPESDKRPSCLIDGKTEFESLPDDDF